MAEAVFGAAVLSRHRPPGIDPEGVDWRASSGNAIHMRQWEQRMAREFGAFSGSRLQAAHVAGQVLFVPGVRLIGSATAADGMLMDVRHELLPSERSR